MINYIFSGEDVDRQKIPIYYLKENSFTFDPGIKSDFSVMVGKSYVGLDISLNQGKVETISGFSPRKQWKKAHIVIPQIVQKGELFVLPEQGWNVGEGIRFADWDANYDSNTGWICFGNKNITTNNEYIEFLNNCIASFNEDMLEAIFIRPLMKK